MKRIKEKRKQEIGREKGDPWFIFWGKRKVRDGLTLQNSGGGEQKKTFPLRESAATGGKKRGFQSWQGGRKSEKKFFAMRESGPGPEGKKKRKKKL